MANKNGRPPKYATPRKLQKAIDDYFKNGVAVRWDTVGKGEAKKRVRVKMPTITGLVLHCGFCDRHSFYAYEKIPLFSHTIKMARSRIEQHYENLLQQGLGAGAIFALKNFGWKDERQLTGPDGGAIEVTYTDARRKLTERIDAIAATREAERIVSHTD